MNINIYQIYVISILFFITVYMDIGTASTATATLAFAFSTTTSTTRQWEVKVTQIKCFGRER